MKLQIDVYHFHMNAPKMHLHVVLFLIMLQLDFYQYMEDTKSFLHVSKAEVQVHLK